MTNFPCVYVLCYYTGFAVQLWAPFHCALLRYFELEGKTLNYYQSSDSMAWKGNFRLTATSRVCSHVVIDDRRCFFLENDSKRLFMMAESDDERERWVHVLRQCISLLASA